MCVDTEEEFNNRQKEYNNLFYDLGLELADEFDGDFGEDWLLNSGIGFINNIYSVRVKTVDYTIYLENNVTYN